MTYRLFRRMTLWQQRMTALLILLAALNTAGCLPGSGKPLPKKSVSLVALLLDTSSSNLFDRRCDELTARVEELLGGAGSLEIITYGLGEPNSTGNEPVVLIPSQRFEPGFDLYEEPDRKEAQKRAWIDRLKTQCQAQLRTRDGSPIFFALHRISASLTARCRELREHEACLPKLFIHSDLFELADQRIVERRIEIGRFVRRGRKPSKPSRALPRLDLSGIEVKVCGLAGHRLLPNEEILPPGALELAWKELGLEATTFDAACPEGYRATTAAPQSE